MTLSHAMTYFILHLLNLIILVMNVDSGYFYHIYNRGNNSQKIFYERENYLFFLRKMKEHISPYASIIAWCLMPNHFHWVVFVHKTTIEIQEKQNPKHTMAQSHGLTVAENSNQKTKQRTFNYSVGILLRSYTRVIQKKEKFRGSLFQQHTGIKLLKDEIKIEPAYWNTVFGTVINIPEGKSYLETCIEYVHQNPVCSGLVEKAEDWEFSSFKDYLGLRKGKLIDYELLKKEGILSLVSEDKNLVMSSNNKLAAKPLGLVGFNEDSHTMTSSHSMTSTVIIGIGSNINAEENISKMLEVLAEHVEILKVSSLLKTKPIGIENQPDFTNGAVKIQTGLNMEELNHLLKSIEDKLCRDRSAPKFGPRTIDLDIVVWNGEIVDEDYYTRDFLRKSVQEIISG